MLKRTLVTLTVAAAFLLGVVIGVQAQDNSTKLTPLPAGPAYQANSSELSTADVYQKVIHSVVNVSVATGQGGAGTGSGFVIDTEGHIVTNNHVVDSASYIEVTFVDGTIVEAQLVGRDPGADLAVIRVEPNQVTLQPVTFADSDQAFVGQQTLAIGSPYGQAFTLTTGIVSAVDRDLQNSVDNFSIPELIQTDAAINPGNSGGPLLDMAGNVIGVNTAILSESGSASGVGFAIPSNTVRRIVPYLIQDGSYQHSWLGIAGTTLMPAQRDAMKLPADLKGVMVSDITRNSPAAKAGLVGADRTTQTPFGNMPIGGDIITAINGTPVTRMTDLIAYLETSTQPGDQVTLSVLRDGNTQDISVTLAARPNTSS